MNQRSYYQQRQRNRLYETVIKALEQAGIKRKDIAEKIGKSQPSISRLLSGPANWSIDTVSDLLFAVDAEMDFRVVPFRERSKANAFHPLGSGGPSSSPGTGSSGTLEIRSRNGA